MIDHARISLPGSPRSTTGPPVWMNQASSNASYAATSAATQPEMTTGAR